MQLWIVIAAYNEETVIATTLADLQEYRNQILVVDDGSTDKTALVATKAGARIIRHAINLGQGAALQTGIDYALELGADYICTFDADGQHSPATIPKLLEALQNNNADVALGSRFLGSTIDIPRHRKILLLLARSFTRYQTGLPLTDVHNGLRLLTRRSCLTFRITQARMAHASEILAAISKHRLRYVEVPTIIRYNAYSIEKGQPSTGFVKILFDLIYAAWTR